MAIKVDKQISVEGSCCPLPLIYIAEALEGMADGQILEILGDDPIFEAGVRDFCLARKLEIISAETIGASVKMIIRV